MHTTCLTKCLTEAASAMESDSHQDLISQLPDHILLRILAKAFADKPTIDLVRTCILLCKRWSNLWASFPHLHLSDYSLARNAGLDPNPEFPRFVNSVLLGRDTSDVQSFFLQWSNRDKHRPRYLATWMQYAVDHNVKELGMNIELNNNFFKPPRSLFTSRFLERLHLSISGLGEVGVVDYLDLPEYVHLGLLRELWLAHFNIVPVSLKTLLSGCPALEDLKLDQCMVQDPVICSESLRKLELVLCEINGTRIHISGSNILYLSIGCNNIDKLEVLLENLPSLVKAYVQTDDYNGFNWDDHARELLKYVSPRFEGMSKKELFERQTFRNLKVLDLDGKLILGNLPTVVHFLERSPNLKLVKLGMQALISLDPIRKKQQMKTFFNCPHLEEMLATFDEENDILSEWLADFCDDKCSCFEE